MAMTWQQHQDSLTLQPVESCIPDICLKHIRMITDVRTLFHPQVEEGDDLRPSGVSPVEERDPTTSPDDLNMPNLCNTDDDDNDSISEANNDNGDDASMTSDTDDSMVPPSQLTTLTTE
jgi:hypothetical protein